MRGVSVVLITGLVLLSTAGTASVLAGGESSPGEVYGLYIVELRDGDIDGMCEYVTAAKVKQLETIPEAQQKQMIQMVQMMAPTEYTVVKEDIRGDAATLTLKGKGKDFSGNITDQVGTVTFKKEGGEWKLVREGWKPATQ